MNKKYIITLLLATMFLTPLMTIAQDSLALAQDSLTVANDSLAIANDLVTSDESMHEMLKTKFIEGNPLFMSFVAITLILGLSFCIERIIYLTLANINSKKFMSDLEQKYQSEGVDAAIELCRSTRGPVASICMQGLLHKDESTEDIERNMTSYADIEIGKLENGCSWITLFIAIAPSLGFLGTVIGMVMSFDDIEIASDISPAIVAGGMKVALITTIFGIIVAVILQLFYNFILSRIEHLTFQMEQSAIDLIEIIKGNTSTTKSEGEINS